VIYDANHPLNLIISKGLFLPVITATTAALYFSHFFKHLHIKGIQNGADAHILKTWKKQYDALGRSKEHAKCVTFL